MNNAYLNNQVSILKQILLLAIPIVGTFLAQKSIQVINTFMLGHLSINALASGSLFLSFYLLVIVIFMGVFNAVNVFISRALGENNSEHIGKYFIHGIYIIILVSIPIMFCMWFLPLLLRFIPEYASIETSTLQLARAASFGIPGTLLYLLLREIMTAFKLSKINFYVVLIVIPVLIIIDYLIVFVSDSTNKIALIGYSNSFTEWFLAMGLLTYAIGSTKINSQIFSRNNFKLDLEKLNDIIKLGLPTGMIFILDVGMVLTASLLAGYYGAVSLAAFQIALQLTSLAYMFPMGIGFAVTTLISHQYGANNFGEIKKIAKIGINIGLGIALFILVLFISFGKELSLLFLINNDSAADTVVFYATRFIIVAGFVQLFDAGLAIANGVLRGVGDATVPMYYSIICYWLFGVGGILVFCFLLHINAIGIWLGLFIGISSTSILVFIRLQNKLKSPALFVKG